MSTLQLTKNQDAFTGADFYKTAPVLFKEMKATASFDFNKWDLDNLTDYIIINHHSYVKKNAVVIYDLAQAVANQHSKNHPELLKFTEITFLFFHDLLNHLMTEEQILIPNIRQLFKKRNFTKATNPVTFGIVRDTVSAMQKEHLAADRYLNLFHQLTDGYKLPADACNSYKYLFKKMKEFERNLVAQINLENNILFPKALALADQLRKEERI